MSSASGPITVNGQGGNAGDSDGVTLTNGASITSTGTITITGNTTSADADADGVLIDGTSSVSSAGGAISITGTSAGDDGIEIAGSVSGTGAATLTSQRTAWN